MLVRLTHNQFQSIDRRMPELYGATMREHRTTAGRTQHDYDMPAIAWRQILDRMMEQCFGPAGGKLKGKGRPSDSAYIAIRKVAEAVRIIEGHPALHGRVLEGWVGDVVPGFCDPVGVRRGWSPYPFTVEGIARFELLVPQHRQNLGMKVTSWAPTAIPHHWSIGHSWTFEPESHLMFSQSPTAVAPT